MPSYSVRLQLNVPGLGERQVVQLDVQAPNMTEAIAIAVANITIRATQVVETTP